MSCFLMNFALRNLVSHTHLANNITLRARMKCKKYFCVFVSRAVSTEQLLSSLKVPPSVTIKIFSISCNRLPHSVTDID